MKSSDLAIIGVIGLGLLFLKNKVIIPPTNPPGPDPDPDPNPGQNFILNLSPANAIFKLEKDSGGGTSTLISGNYILEPTKYFWTCSLSGYSTQSGYFEIVAGQVESLNVSLVTISTDSYEIINPYFNNDGLNLTFKNNNVPIVDTSSDWNTAPVWIRFNVFVDLIKPYPWGYQSLLTKRIVDVRPYNHPNNFKVPNTGKSASFFIPFTDSDENNTLAELIAGGYINEDLSQIKITGISFDNWYDYNAGYQPYNVKPSKPLAFPILVNRI